jgi:putative acetyltransferase
MPATAEIEIRAYRAADLDAVIAIFLGAVTQVASRDYTPLQIAAWARADREAWSRTRLSRPTWVAVVGGAVAGFTDLEPNGHLDMMYVHPERQGVGVATALLETVELAARRQALSRLFTEASLTALPFFERRGFSVVAPRLAIVRGQGLRNFKMEKFLVQAKPV